jgi:hypothetical protein
VNGRERERERERESRLKVQSSQSNPSDGGCCCSVLVNNSSISTERANTKRTHVSTRTRVANIETMMMMMVRLKDRRTADRVVISKANLFQCEWSKVVGG